MLVYVWQPSFVSDSSSYVEGCLGLLLIDWESCYILLLKKDGLKCASSTWTDLICTNTKIS